MSDERQFPGQATDVQEAHYHVLRGGQQFLIVKHSHAWRPPTDVMEDQNQIIVLVEVAGMQGADFHVSLSNQRLTISGVRAAREPAHSAYNQLEIRYGDFRTDVILPWPVEEGKINARYEDGFLRVELPRAAPHRVQVEV